MNKIIAKFAFVAMVAGMVAFGGSLSARADYNSCMTGCGQGIQGCIYSCGAPYFSYVYQGCINACYASLAQCQANCHR